MRRSRRSIPAIALTMLGLLAAPLAGQTRQLLPEGTSAGGTADLYELGGYVATGVTVRVSQVRPGGLGGEFGVATFPEALRGGVLVLAPDAGLAYHAPMQQASLLLKAGVSGFLAAAGRDADARLGMHLGAGLLVRVDKGLALRVDVTRRWLLFQQDLVPVNSIGLGLMSLKIP